MKNKQNPENISSTNPGPITKNVSGLDPNSPFMVYYINSSKGKNGWKNIHEEIGGFYEIMIDDAEPWDRRVDAQGYFAICQFKILGNLCEGAEEERERKFNELQQKQVFSRYFGLDDEAATHQQVFGATKTNAESLVKECEGQETYPHQSSLNSALAVLIKLPFYDQNLSEKEKKQAVTESCKIYAQRHFDSAKKAAELGEQVENGRGWVFLVSALDNFYPNPPYAKAINPGSLLLKNGAQISPEFCTQKSAELGCLSSFGDLGKYAKKREDFETAEQNFRTAAQAGFAEFQFELGRLLSGKQGGKDEGLEWLKKAQENEFDVAGKLTKELQSFPPLGQRIILRETLHSLGKIQEEEKSAER